MRLRKDAKVELLKRVPLFSKLDKKGLEDVAQIADEIDLPAGKEMATEGDRGREFFVLLKGEADVTRGGQKINSMKEGDFFGEIALVVTKRVCEELLRGEVVEVRRKLVEAEPA